MYITCLLGGLNRRNDHSECQKCLVEVSLDLYGDCYSRVLTKDSKFTVFLSTTVKTSNKGLLKLLNTGQKRDFSVTILCTLSFFFRVPFKFQLLYKLLVKTSLWPDDRTVTKGEVLAFTTILRPLITRPVTS